MSVCGHSQNLCTDTLPAFYTCPSDTSQTFVAITLGQMDTISVRLIERMDLLQEVDSCKAYTSNAESMAFYNRIIANNLQYQVEALKRNESDLKNTLDISGHTIADYKQQLHIQKMRGLRNWLLSGGIGFGIGGGCGVAIGRR